VSHQTKLQAQKLAAMLVKGSAIAGLLALSSCARQEISQSESMLRPDLEVFCPGQNHQPETLQIVDTRDWTEGKIVLYEGTCRHVQDTSPLSVTGYQVFVRHGMTWRASSGGSVTAPSQEATSARRINYYTVGQVEGRDPNDRYTMVEGQISSSDVVAVEVRFDTGEVLRDRVEKERFVTIAAGADRACELQIFGADNRLLERKRLSNTCPAD
jgi:hypothetical protein